MSTGTDTIPQFGLGDRMRKARETAGMDQADLASLLGVSRALVSMWERGLSDPRTAQIRRWAEETSQPLWWLLDLPRSEEASAPVNRGKGAYISSPALAA